MGLDGLLARLECRAVTSVTAPETPDVTRKPAQLVPCTSVTSVTLSKEISPLSEPNRVPFDREAWEERAAIAEFDGGLSREKAEALAWAEDDRRREQSAHGDHRHRPALRSANDPGPSIRPTMRLCCDCIHGTPALAGSAVSWHSCIVPKESHWHGWWGLSEHYCEAWEAQPDRRPPVAAGAPFDDEKGTPWAKSKP